jgi:hypothetical protein
MAAFGADPGAGLVVPAEALEGGEEAPVIHAHLALPLPPHLAALFLRVPPIWRARKTTNPFRQVVPAKHRGLFAPIFKFV